MNKFVKEYQCPGCMFGDEGCFEQCQHSESCKKHYAGTLLSNIGKIFLGLPNGFNRLGEQKQIEIKIYKDFEQKQNWEYDKFNIPAWKYINEHNHLLVRGYSPRINKGFIHIFLSGDFKKVDCLELTKKDIEEMD